MTDYDPEREVTLRQRILAALDGLSSKQVQLARYFLDSENEIAFFSAKEVGKETNTSAATVVRFAQLLGYKGYAEMQEQVRATFAEYENRTASQKLAERIAQGKFNHELPAHIADVNIRNIQETFRRISLKSLSEAVDHILDAERIMIFGGGLSAASVILAEHSLRMLGFPVRAIVNGGLSQSLELVGLTQRDAVIAISIWRYLRETVEAAEYAAALGATTIGITDSLVSPIARIADYTFIAATERAAHSRSLGGISALIDLINAVIVSKRPQESMQALERLDNFYQKQGIVMLGDIDG